MPTPTPLDMARRSTPPNRPPLTPRQRFERGIRRSELPTSARLVGLVLATWSDPVTGVIADADQPGVNTIAKAAGLTNGTIHACLATLLAGGWIERTPAPPEAGPKAATRTVLTIPPGRTNPR